MKSAYERMSDSLIPDEIQELEAAKRALQQAKERLAETADNHTHLVGERNHGILMAHNAGVTTTEIAELTSLTR